MIAHSFVNVPRAMDSTGDWFLSNIHIYIHLRLLSYCEFQRKLCDLVVRLCKLLSRAICKLVHEPNLYVLTMAMWLSQPLTNLAHDQGVHETLQVVRS